MTVDLAIVRTFEISAESEALQSQKEFRVVGKHIFERAMSVAGFPNEDASCLFDDICFYDSGVLSEGRDITFTSNDSIYCLMVAVRA
jgi:hypothetical protein